MLRCSARALLHVGMALAILWLPQIFAVSFKSTSSTSLCQVLPVRGTMGFLFSQHQQVLLRLKGGGGEGVRLAIRKKKGNAFTHRRNKPEKRSKKNLSVVQQANLKITKHIIERNENLSAQRAGIVGEKMKMVIHNQRSNMDRKLNMPSSRPGDKYVQRIRSLAGQQNTRKGGSVGKSKRRR